MSSRLLRNGPLSSATPMTWRNASDSPADRPHAPSSRTDGLSEMREQLAEMERQTEARVKAAYQQGQAATEASATQRAAQRMEPVLATFESTDPGACREVAKRFRTEAEEDTVKLAIAISQDGCCIVNWPPIPKPSWVW